MRTVVSLPWGALVCVQSPQEDTEGDQGISAVGVLCQPDNSIQKLAWCEDDTGHLVGARGTQTTDLW